MLASTDHRLILAMLALALAMGGCKRAAGDSAAAANAPGGAAEGAAAVVQRDPLVGLWKVTDVRGAGQLPPALANLVDSLKTSMISLHADHTFRSFNADAGGYSGTWATDGNTIALSKGPYQSDQAPATKRLTVDGETLLDANDAYTIVYGQLPSDALPVKVSIDDFLAVKDDAAFKARYYDKPVELAGVVHSINGFTGVVMLRDPTDAGSTNYAQCYLTNYADYGKLSNGQAVTLRGIAVGEAGASAIEDCQIESASSSMAVAITAADLAGEFARDSDAAMKKYAPDSGAKTIFLTGPLFSRNPEDDPTPQLFLGTDSAKVDCTFTDDDAKRLQKFKPGQEIHVAGELANSGTKSAELENCYIVLPR
ncbi:MAG TPA: hypothetical protein VHY37_09950 [Tepidisphaeraceae bacterium]|jgi:hypothetical protein|nr:hypothetical protein [Tepidisphaeraceae bacterium]